MKQLRMCAILMLSLALLLMPFAVAESLTASIEGNMLHVRWNVDCGGTAVLTVYQNNWPISICNVSCAEGGASVNLGNPSGKYSVRLRTSLGCLMADASAGEAAQPTAVPETPEITAAPTATPEITAAPTAASTPAPTATPRPAATATPKPASGSGQTDLASEVIALVNAERANAGLSTLRVDSELTRAACVRAQEIVRQFSHTRPDGTSWSTVSSSAHGENIAKGYRNASAVMVGWMNSQGHRENILRGSFRSIGVCAYTYNGTIYWVQLFG